MAKMMMKSMMKSAPKMKMAKMMKKSVMKMKTMRKSMKKTAKAYKTKKGALRAVFLGRITASKGGLKKSALMKTKSGKIVSSKKYALGKKSKWMAACAKARTALKVKGFTPVGGKTAAGKALLSKAKSFYKK
jgi:hypothetical protein